MCSTSLFNHSKVQEGEGEGRRRGQGVEGEVVKKKKGYKKREKESDEPID